VAEELLADTKTTYILDSFHALGYAAEAMRELFPGERERKMGLEHMKTQSLKGNVGTFIEGLTPYRHKSEAITRCIDYCKASTERMRYDGYRVRGLQTGSDQIESAAQNACLQPLQEVRGCRPR